jgi:hypothetical protein
VALYGPDDKTTTKIAAGVILHDGAEPPSATPCKSSAWAITMPPSSSRCGRWPSARWGI